MVVTKLKKLISGLLLLLILLLSTSSKVNAKCIKLNPREYECCAGNIFDFKKVPNNTYRLDIDFMPIKRLKPNLLSRFQDLKFLKITNGQIVSIDDNTFSNNKNLQWLQLHKNFIKNLKTNQFQGLNSLTILNFGENNINHIECDLFEKTLPNLELLNLSHNNLSCFNFNFGNQKNLIAVDLRDNKEFKCPNALMKYMNERNKKLLYSQELDKIEDTLESDSDCSPNFIVS